jgi:hypothetical protein
VSNFHFDVFLSYSRKDALAGPNFAQPWPYAIAKYIEGIDHVSTGRLSVFVDKTEIRYVEDWRHRIQGALRCSRVLLVFLSNNYFESECCMWEYEEFLQRQGSRGLRGPGEYIQAIFLEKVDKKALGNKQRLWFDTVRRSTTVDFSDFFLGGSQQLNQDHRVSYLAATFGNELSKMLDVAPGATAERFSGNLRAANDHFVGRRTQLQRLNEAVAVGRLGVITALHGLGGIGKTELSVFYANQYRANFKAGIWWVNAERSCTLKGAIGLLADDAKFNKGETPRNDEESKFQFVIERLRQDVLQAQAPRGAAQVLLLLDNVTQPQIISANQRVHTVNCSWLSLLVTTRSTLTNWKFGDSLAVMELNELDEQDAMDLIREWQPTKTFNCEEDRNQALKLVRMLGSYTLAVEQVAILLGTQPDLRIEALVNLLKKNGLTELDDRASKSIEVTSVQQHREKQISKVLDQTLPDQKELAHALLRYSCLFSADVIPKAWIEDLVHSYEPHLLENETFASAWAWLSHRRLIGESTSHLMRMHRLIHAHLRHRFFIGSEIVEKTKTILALFSPQVNDRLFLDSWKLNALIQMKHSNEQTSN